MIYSILCLIGIIGVIVWRYLDGLYRTDDKTFNDGLTIGALSVGFFVFLLYGLSGLAPSAQDVVDGKTTYKVIYIDNVPTDSVLVYKNEYKHINWW